MLKPAKAGVKNIIFDLGGVIIDIDFHESIKAYSEISTLSTQEVLKRADSSSIFIEYEKGLISDEEFRMGIRLLLDCNVSDNTIDNAWNALLLNIPSHRWDWLGKAKQSYNTYILSNTNATHIRRFHEIVDRSIGADEFYGLFDKVYYSSDIKMRKPDQEIFEYVLDQNNLSPEETLFIDDNEENIAAAKNVGIQVFHVLQNKPDYGMIFGHE